MTLPVQCLGDAGSTWMCLQMVARPVIHTNSASPLKKKIRKRFVEGIFSVILLLNLNLESFVIANDD